jgi:altronate hydrolase
MVCMASTSPIEQLAVLLHPDDNIAVARQSLVAGTRIIHTGPPINLRDAVKLGHKFALQPIECGSAVRKFGQIIGFASRDIAVGEHVHTHNVACGQYDRQAELAVDRPDVPAPLGTSTFEGFLRPDGRVGTRNYVAVVSTVNCSASTVDRIARTFTSERLRPYPNVDGVFAITHKTGCGMAGSGLDRDHLSRTLHGFSHHPNVFGYVLVGLGCEVNQANQLIEREQLLGRSSMPAPRVFTVQGEGSIAKTVARGVAAVEELLERANIVRRSTQPVSKLVLGTNCGGSDGNSGITANPALGYASDQIIAHGGTSILGETTEIYGAEHLLTRRAVSADVGRKLLERIRWWEWYTSLFNATIDNNPSFGNKEGGLTTIFEKSLGAIAKGGSTAMVDVVHYAEPVKQKGFIVMDTPGYDPVSMTGIVAGGANVLVFTTGRGSVFGCKPAPSIKIATNSPLYHHMLGDMDINAGRVLEGVTVEEVGREIFEEILAVASGKKTKSEINDVGEEEFAPWGIGPTL